VIIPNRRDTGPGGGAKAAPTETENLLRRTASALVLAPLAIAVALWGGWLFATACAITAVIVVWEWTVLVARAADWRIVAPSAAVLCAVAVLLQQKAPLAAGAAIAIGASIAAGATAMLRNRESAGISPSGISPSGFSPAWIACGVVYASIIPMGLIPLRSDPDIGPAALFFVFATVWATDIFAYLIGNMLRGPLLWPRLSPKKTWAGAIGGLAGGIAAGAAVAYASAGTQPLIAGFLAMILSIAAQAGDLFESWVKRRFGAKDSSRLIPGHGGVMDRVDGLLVAGLAAFLIGALRAGTAASARGLLLW
jgi:phosphatidate cytidylyltransferase